MESPSNKFYKFCPNCKTPLMKRVVDGKERLKCEKCGFTLWGNPKPTVSAVLESEGKFLLLKRSSQPFKDYWVLPGGYMEYDENPKQAIVRETKEETGLDIKVESLIDVYLIDNDPRGNSLDVVYYATIVGGRLKLKEHSEYKFFLPDELPEHIGYKHRQMIENWCKTKD